MTIRHHKNHSVKLRQNGVALIVALIFLLAMTAIGVSSFVNTTLQERMVTSNRQTDLAVQAAIVATKEANKWLEATMNGDMAGLKIFFSGCSGFYQPFGIYDQNNVLFKSRPVYDYPLFSNGFDIYSSDAWLKNSTKVRTVGGILSSDVAAHDPQYIIELLGVGADADIAFGRTLKEFGKPDNSNAYDVHFRITAMGWGRDTNVSSLLQSTVKMKLADNGTAGLSCP